MCVFFFYFLFKLHRTIGFKTGGDEEGEHQCPLSPLNCEISGNMPAHTLDRDEKLR
jgi:hypothetical protein